MSKECPLTEQEGHHECQTAWLRILFFFLGCILCIWKFPSRGPNASHSCCDLGHNADNAGSLIHGARTGMEPISPERRHWILNLLHYSRNSLAAPSQGNFFHISGPEFPDLSSGDNGLLRGSATEIKGANVEEQAWSSLCQLPSPLMIV